MRLRRGTGCDSSSQPETGLKILKTKVLNVLNVALFICFYVKNALTETEK